MNSNTPNSSLPHAVEIPKHRDLYYDGAWQTPLGGYLDTFNPATGENLGPCAEANEQDVNRAVQAAFAAQKNWAAMKPLERAGLLKKVAAVLREHSFELAMLDAMNCGNPISEMQRDAVIAAAQIEYYAGLASEVKGETIPMGEGVLNYSLREPFGVCARIVAYNHPIMFTAAKMAPPLITGNTVIMKPPYQSPLSTYRMMELIDGILPKGVLNIITGNIVAGQSLVSHPQVPRISLIGSVPTGRAIAKAGADQLKHITLELGGKNACIIYPDADLEKAALAAVNGMNFTWCGQSCGSTSRLFIHDSVYEPVMAMVLQHIKRYQPGIPTDMNTTMGSIVSKAQWEKIMGYIELAKREGATLVHGGKAPEDLALQQGWFVQPTVFTDVTQQMRIANEEVFGPVLSVLRWKEEAKLFADVNAVEYGLTASIWTRDLGAAHKAAARVQAGFVWINHVSSHFIGASFGGVKQSGIGREEGFEELLSYTQSKNVHVVL
jgi:betaine-aldehyde dehydrogenase